MRVRRSVRKTHPPSQTNAIQPPQQPMAARAAACSGCMTLASWCALPSREAARGPACARMEAAPAPPGLYSVARRAVVRAGVEADSERVALLKVGEVVEVLEEAVDAEGARRVRIDRGWTSLEAKDGSPALQPAEQPSAAAEPEPEPEPEPELPPPWLCRTVGQPRERLQPFTAEVVVLNFWRCPNIHIAVLSQWSRPVSGGGRVGRASSKLPCIVCLSMQPHP